MRDMTHRGFITVVLLIGIANMLNASEAEIAATEAGKHTRRIRILINEDYGKEVEGKLPFQRDVSRLCELAGWSTAHEGEPCDAILAITAVVCGLGANYDGAGFYYTGASVHGTIRVEKSGQLVFGRSFVGHIKPRGFAGENQYMKGCCIKACSAAYPFAFVPAFMDAVAVTFGPEPLILTCGGNGDGMTWDYLRSESKAALLRMGESALPALSKAVSLSDGREQLSSRSDIERTQIADDCRALIARIRLGAAVDYAALSNAYQAGQVHLYSEACMFATPESGCRELTTAALEKSEKRHFNVKVHSEERTLYLRDLRDPRIVPFIIQTRSDSSSGNFFDIAQDTRDLRFVDPLIEILRGENRDARLRSARALESITGQDMGSDYDNAGAWADWWKEHSTTKFDRMTGYSAADGWGLLRKRP